MKAPASDDGDVNSKLWMEALPEKNQTEREGTGSLGVTENSCRRANSVL